MLLSMKSLSRRCLHLSRAAQARQEQVMNVFDRQAKVLQKERSAQRADVNDFDYLKEEFGYRLADRVLDISRELNVCLDIGSGRGYFSRHLSSHNVKKVICLEMSETMLEQCQPPAPEENIEFQRLHLNEDNQALPFEDESINLVTSSLSMHWVNNLPGLFREVQRVLKKDGVFLGSMFGGDTLFELRGSLQLAELEREGGFAGSHVSPYVDVQDLGNLLNRSGFTMLTIDSDELVVNFPSVMQLMRDLKGMAENNATWSRKLRINRESLLAADAIYKALYGLDNGRIPATFQVYNWIGWKPHPDQPKPLKPQTSEVSLKDLGKLNEILKDVPDAK